MKVHLRKRKMRLKKSTSKPRYSLDLDIYYRKGKRKREFLGIYLEPQDDKTYRNKKLELAESIKVKRMMELANEAHGFPQKRSSPLRMKQSETTSPGIYSSVSFFLNSLEVNSMKQPNTNIIIPEKRLML